MKNIYKFTLVLNGVDDETPGIEDHLFEIGCDDALINYKNGVIYLDFDREGTDLEQVIISTIKEIEAAKIGATVVSVAPEHLVSLSEIAKRVSLTRQAVSLLALGERGLGGFPKPVFKIANKSPLWRWRSVAEWLFEQGKLLDHSLVEYATVIEDINSALELRNNQLLEHRKNIIKKLKTRL
jgi:hypothetical protein